MKRVTGIFGFTIDDDAEQYVENIMGAMHVQIDENVVEYDESGNERSILTSDITLAHTVAEASREEALRHILLRKMIGEASDEDSELVKDWLRTYGPEDDSGVSQALVAAFPVEADRVMHENASTEIWMLADDKVDDIISAAEKADGMGRWHYAQHGALCGAGDEAFTTGDTDRVTCAACRRLIAEDEEGEYVGPLAPFTKLIDAVYANHEGVVNDVSTGEVGDALLLLDLGDGYALGVSDYTESWWDACLYLDRYELDGALAMFVTESIGRVEVAGDVEQTEVGRRIAYYLNTDQFNIDKETLRRRKGEQ